jgi:hypothetical protein
MHIVSKGSVQAGLFTAFYGFLFGSTYLVVGTDYKKGTLHHKLVVVKVLF